MIRQTGVLTDDLAHIGRHKLVSLTTRHKQDAIDDTDGPLTAHLNLLHLVFYAGHDFTDILAVSFRQTVCIALYNLRQVIKETIGYLGEVNDKVQWVLYLMGDTGTQQSQRCQFLLLL